MTLRIGYSVGSCGRAAGAGPNQDGLESAKPDLQSMFKKPGDDPAGHRPRGNASRCESEGSRCRRAVVGRSAVVIGRSFRKGVKKHLCEEPVSRPGDSPVISRAARIPVTGGRSSGYTEPRERLT